MTKHRSDRHARPLGDLFGRSRWTELGEYGIGGFQDEFSVAASVCSSSKLCNILPVRALRNLPEAQAKNLVVLAFDPGPTPGTGLLRNAPAIGRIMWRTFGPVLRRVVRRFNSNEAVSGQLAAIALGEVNPPAEFYYAAVRRNDLHWLQPSELAQDDNARDAMWTDSAVMVGLEMR